MPNYVGVQLSRAIRARAYAAGVVEKKHARIAGLQAALKAAKQECREAAAALAECDSEVTRLATIDTRTIRPIRHHPRSGLFKYGALSTEIIRIVKDAKEPIQTPCIVACVSERLGLPITTSAEWAVTRRRVVKQLQAYARRGAVERLHDPDKTEVGAWRWKGL